MSWAKAKNAIATILADIKIERNWIGNPSVETNISFITATGPTLARVTTQAKWGAASLEATGSAGSSDIVEWESAGVKLPVIASEPYCWSVYVKPAVGTSVAGRLGIKWYTSAPALISESTATAVSINSGDDWVRLTLKAVAPSNAASAVVNFQESPFGWAATKILYFDGAMFNHGYERPYFDGASPGCAWDNDPPTDPDNSNRIIKKVYTDPPGVLQDVPCFVIFPPPVENEVLMGQRWRKYEVPVQCFISDQDKDQAAALVDLARERLIPAFDGATTPLEWASSTGIGVGLSSGATMAYVKSVGPAVGLEYPRGSGKFYSGFEATIFVEIKEGVDFAV